MTSADRLDQLLEMWRRDIDSVPFPEIGLTDIPLQRDGDDSRSYPDSHLRGAGQQSTPEERTRAARRAS